MPLGQAEIISPLPRRVLWSRLPPPLPRDVPAPRVPLRDRGDDVSGVRGLRRGRTTPRRSP